MCDASRPTSDQLAIVAFGNGDEENEGASGKSESEHWLAHCHAKVA